MATTYTQNYGLGKQEDHSDKFDMSVITANADIIDRELKSQQNQLNTKSDAGDIAALQAQIDQIVISASAESVVAPEVAAARVGADSTSYQTLKARLDAENENVKNKINDVAEVTISTQKNIYNESSTNVIDELGNSTHIYGLRTGYWGDDGTRTGNSTYLMFVEKIRSFDDAGYSTYFNGSLFGAISFPNSALFCRVKSWDSDNNLKQNLTLRSGETFAIIPNCKYGIYFKFESDAESYLTEAFASNVIIYKYSDRLNQIDTSITNINAEIEVLKTGELYAHSIGWNLFNSTSSVFHGWKVGYYRGDNGNFDSAPKYLCTSKMLTNKELEGAKKIKIKVGSDYGVAISEWDAEDNYITRHGSINTSVAGYTSEVELELTATHKYAFSIGRWGNDDAGDYLNDTFFNTVEFTIFSTSEKIPNLDTFMRFTVQTNILWCDTTSDSSDNEEPVSLNDVKCILRLPSNYSVDGEPVPLIMFGHGSSSYISDTSWSGNNTTSATNGNHLKLIDTFVSAGYAVFDVNNTRNNPDGFYEWGCTPLMSAYIKALEYIRENFNVSDKLFQLSVSMGTVANLNYMKWYHGEVAASVILAPRPVCSLRYEMQTAPYKREMEQAFGIETEGEWDYNRLRSFDHYENMVTIDEKNMILDKYPPIKALAGTEDDTLLTEVREYFTALSNAGSYVSYREIDGANHADMCTLREPYTALQTECVNWFNRFR